MTMKTSGKKSKMTREEAEELYDDLRKAMATMMKNHTDDSPAARVAPASVSANVGQRQTAPRSAGPRSMVRPRAREGEGQRYAILFVISLVFIKIILSGLEAAGLGTVQAVDASMLQDASRSRAALTERFSKEEIDVLSSLDARRAELETRAKKLQMKEEEIAQRDQQLATRLTELRDLTGRLRVNREKDEKKRSDKLDQLANVYGSMNPPEAAALMEQLDVTIALELIQKMPEKRIAQILALMTPNKALTITRMLSEKVK